MQHVITAADAPGKECGVFVLRRQSRAQPLVGTEILSRGKGYEGTDFAPPTVFALDELPRASDGSILVAATTNEEDSSATSPDPKRR